MVSVLASILVRVGAKRATRLLVAGQGISSVGTGVVVPLTLIYLHQVRGIPLAVTGALFAAAAVMGLVTVPLAGVLLDRAGGDLYRSPISFSHPMTPGWTCEVRHEGDSSTLSSGHSGVIQSASPARICPATDMTARPGSSA